VIIWFDYDEGRYCKKMVWSRLSNISSATARTAFTRGLLELLENV